MVSEFIARTMFDRFEWGVCDCLLWPATLIREATGLDPARDWRGTYSTAFGCRRIVMAAGGLLALVRQTMPPPDGARDTGVCIVRYGGRVIGGILSGGTAHLKTASGVIKLRDPDILAGWAV